MRFRTDDDLAGAIDALRRSDPELIEPLWAAVGSPPLRRRPQGLPGLAGIVVGQQVSTASADAIFGRLVADLDLLTPTALLSGGADVLRACGLSAPKIRALLAIARATQEGQLDFERVGAAAPDAARAELLTVTGIGPWTADIYLLFCLGHADTWPGGDLALQEAMRVLIGLDTRPKPAVSAQIATRWRPYRGAAAHLLWAYYRIAARRTKRQGRLDPGTDHPQPEALGKER